ncbi:hypothetical protein E2C01_061342 [Portunus trituberculatus]|uniref:Uncharacterized protein n=1 Tax=Portunus trituberculatus TaxID=210409 RepID=A0A5B7HCX7_PORTR|nr:hypothetical protein [Portunus trituberculatus]
MQSSLKAWMVPHHCRGVPISLRLLPAASLADPEGPHTRPCASQNKALTRFLTPQNLLFPSSLTLNLGQRGNLWQPLYLTSNLGCPPVPSRGRLGEEDWPWQLAGPPPLPTPADLCPLVTSDPASVTSHIHLQLICVSSHSVQTFRAGSRQEARHTWSCSLTGDWGSQPSDGTRLTLSQLFTQCCKDPLRCTKIYQTAFLSQILNALMLYRLNYNPVLVLRGGHTPQRIFSIPVMLPRRLRLSCPSRPTAPRSSQ